MSRQLSVHVEHVGMVSHPYYGWIERIRIYRDDHKRMNWEQVHKAFSSERPDQWALEIFPPMGQLVNEVHTYHLWVLPEGTDPDPMRIDWR